MRHVLHFQSDKFERKYNKKSQEGRSQLSFNISHFGCFVKFCEVIFIDLEMGIAAAIPISRSMKMKRYIVAWVSENRVPIVTTNSSTEFLPQFYVCSADTTCCWKLRLLLLNNKVVSKWRNCQISLIKLYQKQKRFSPQLSHLQLLWVTA